MYENLSQNFIKVRIKIVWIFQNFQTTLSVWQPCLKLYSKLKSIELWVEINKLKNKPILQKWHKKYEFGLFVGLK